MKRNDYISWDEYFMGIAFLSAQRSKDENTQVGCCIVNGENKILSLGYNGMPTGCDDDKMPWKRQGAPLDTKYMYVCHAELNAILNRSSGTLQGAKLYVTRLFSRAYARLCTRLISTTAKITTLHQNACLIW